MRFDLPSPASDVDEDGDFAREWVAYFTKVTAGIVGRTQAGPTAERPTSQLEIGLPYYDTTLGYLICVHQVKPAVVWHNGAGAAV